MVTKSEQPLVGATYEPGPAIIRTSQGLPRTVTSVETREGLDVFVVHFTTVEGRGWESGNVWATWMANTDATPALQAAY